MSNYLSFLLCKAKREIAQEVNAHLLPIGITLNQLMVLDVINQKPCDTFTYYAKMLCTDRSTLTRSRALLVLNGWIEFVYSPDKRRKEVKLTKLGALMVERGMYHVDCIEKSIEERFNNGLYNSCCYNLKSIINDK